MVDEERQLVGTTTDDELDEGDGGGYSRQDPEGRTGNLNII